MCDLHGRGARRDSPPIAPQDGERRAFLKGLVALPLAAVLFDPVLVRAQTGNTEMVEIPIEGAKPARGALALPEAESAPALLLVHEWWGLNDQIKAVAADFAKLGFVAFAIDLFDADPAKDPDGALKLVQGLDQAVATAKLVAAVEWLAGHERSNGRVATIGWGFGGGWALNVSLATPVSATVVYYGNVDKTAADLKTISGPVLGHFGTLDQNITRDMVERFEAAMTEAGKAELLAVYWYEAHHAFANPTGRLYDADDARLARDRTVEFLRAGLA
jgi:carboxymethylenebutenolidase